MQFDKGTSNGNSYGYDPFEDLTTPPVKYRPMSSPSSSSNSIYGNGNGNGLKYIEHTVSKMDTLAGVAIKYGVEVVDIKRMNGLVSDLQMFALKSLQIPLPGRHPPSPILSNGSATPGKSSAEQTQSRSACSDILESLQSLKFESPQRKVSPAMSSLQGYYRLKPQNNKHTEKETEMAVYSTVRAHYLEDGPFSERSILSEPPPNRHRKSRSLVNDILSEEGGLDEDVPVVEVGDGESEKLKKSVRRRQKAETDIGSHTLNMPLMEDSGGGSGFSAITGKGLALRPKSSSRIALAADADAVPVGLGDSVVTSLFEGVRKSSSTSNLQDQESNGSSIWMASKWSLKPDLQAAASLARPIFDGLPKPMTGRRSKAALD